MVNNLKCKQLSSQRTTNVMWEGVYKIYTHREDSFSLPVDSPVPTSVSLQMSLHVVCAHAIFCHIFTTECKQTNKHICRARASKRRYVHH